MTRIRFRKNDQVLVITGRDRGKKGKVLKVLPARRRAIVEGIFLIAKHARRTQENPKGGIVRREAPIHLSNLKLVCPRCGKSTRIGQSVLADGSKKRMCKRCKEIL